MSAAFDLRGVGMRYGASRGAVGRRSGPLRRPAHGRRGAERGGEVDAARHHGRTSSRVSTGSAASTAWR